MGNAEERKQPPLVSNLLKKIDASPGFAGLGGAVQTISHLIDNDGSSNKIVATILRDPALTANLLRVANSSSSTKGGHNISTIEQVLPVLGQNTVKSIALSMVSLSSLSNKQQSNQLHAEIVAGSFAGSLAAEITRYYGLTYGVQEAQVCGLMQNLGRMMSIFHLYGDIERSRKLQTDKNIAETEAVFQTFGLSFEDIGVAIARHWGLPDVLQNSLAPDTAEVPPEAAASAMIWHQLCSLFCRRITEALFRFPENRERVEIPKCIDFFQRALNLKGKEVPELIENCLRETNAILTSMTYPCDVENARKLLRKASERATDMLSAKDSLVKKEKGQVPIENAKHLMRLIHDHCGFDCTLICLPSGTSGMVAIAGVGRNAAMLTTKFRSSGITMDIFQVIMNRMSDTYVADVNLPAYAGLIPKWYFEFVRAKSFVMLPLASKGKLHGLLYGDYSIQPASAPKGMNEGIMKEWRTQLIQILNP